MTDNEIIKAVECCIGNTRCGECPMFRTPNCMNRVFGYVCDLINRQNAEIERLENKKYIKIVKCIATNMYEEKSKVIKEFADRFKNIADKTTIKYVDDYGKVSFLINEVDLDNLVKEMTENDFKEE